ncbi:MAG TPA: mechanosensitive ion channel family protein, partial [Chitinophagaceae bacterium]
IILISLVALRLIKKIAIVRLQKLSQKTNTTIDDFLMLLIERSVLPFFYILSIYVGISYLALESRIQNILKIVLLVAGTFFAIRLVTSAISYFVNTFTRSEIDAELKRKQARGILIIANIIVWILGIIFLIDNLGYDITTLVAGLGIGGIAIALAAQAVLGDLFSYFVIFFDKPFEIGDFIIIGDKMGTVEYIGIKTTRLRALGGEQLIMSNTDLTNSRVQNYKRMEKRRVVFSVGVLYETHPDKLRKIPAIIKKIIQEQTQVEFDRAHLSKFGSSSVDYEVVYYIAGADYNVFMDKQQLINLGIFEQFHNEGISFAYPTQTIYFGNSESENERRKYASTHSKYNWHQ